MNIKKSTYLFDVSSHFARAYFRLTKNGERTGTDDYYNGKPVFVLDMLLKMIYKEIRLAKQFGYEYNYIALVFDHPGKNFRHQEFPKYKSDRPPKPEDYTIQMDLAYEMFQTQGFPCIRKEGVESDDVIGTLTTKLSARGFPCVIFGKDKDTLQLVNDLVVQYNGQANVLYDNAKVFAKFGVPPAKIPDYLAMVGDSTDGLQGIKGVGPTTASAILEKMSLIEFANNPDKLANSGIRGIKNVIEIIKKDPSTPKLMRSLTTLKTDVQLGLNIKDLTKGEAIVENYLDTIT